MKTRVSLKCSVNDCSINKPYFTKFSNFVVAKLKLLLKLSDFLLLGVTNIVLVLRFKKTNKFYCFYAAKIVKSKE